MQKMRTFSVEQLHGTYLKRDISSYDVIKSQGYPKGKSRADNPETRATGLNIPKRKSEALQCNSQKEKKNKIMIYKILHRKLNIE